MDKPSAVSASTERYASLETLTSHYAQLAMTKGWIDYTRHRVKELRDSNEMWKDLPRLVKERIEQLKNQKQKNEIRRQG
jgi:hypothetical protein